MLSAIIFVLLIWTIWGNTALTVNNVKISSSRIPAAFSGFRIALVSDLHNAEFGKGNKKLLKMLSESKPDIIVITGDLVDAGHTDIGVALRFARGAVNIAPVYYVTGNHEASLPQYDAGLFTSGSTNMIVSRGLGNSIIPIRFNNRPEVIVIELLKYLRFYLKLTVTHSIISKKAEVI